MPGNCSYRTAASRATATCENVRRKVRSQIALTCYLGYDLKHPVVMQTLVKRIGSLDQLNIGRNPIRKMVNTPPDWSDHFVGFDAGKYSFDDRYHYHL